MTSSSPFDEIHISQTAQQKQSRYLTPEELRDALRNGRGYVCRRASPNHDDLYEQNKFLMRGTFHGKDLDIVFVINEASVTVVTQMSQHATSVKGHFYERVGETAADALDYVEKQNT